MHAVHEQSANFRRFPYRFVVRLIRWTERDKKLSFGDYCVARLLISLGCLLLSNEVRSIIFLCTHRIGSVRNRPLKRKWIRWCQCLEGWCWVVLHRIWMKFFKPESGLIYYWMVVAKWDYENCRKVATAFYLSTVLACFVFSIISLELNNFMFNKERISTFLNLLTLLLFFWKKLKAF